MSNQQAKMTVTRFAGTWPEIEAKLYSGPFINKDQIQAAEGESLYLTIADFQFFDGVQRPASRDLVSFLGLKFEETDKALPLDCKENRGTLRDRYGDDTQAAIGAKLRIFINPDVTVGRKREGGIRFEIVADPPSSTQATDQPAKPTSITSKEGLHFDGLMHKARNLDELQAIGLKLAERQDLLNPGENTLLRGVYNQVRGILLRAAVNAEKMNAQPKHLEKED